MRLFVAFTCLLITINAHALYDVVNLGTLVDENSNNNDNQYGPNEVNGTRVVGYSRDGSNNLILNVWDNGAATILNNAIGFVGHTVTGTGVIYGKRDLGGGNFVATGMSIAAGQVSPTDLPQLTVNGNTITPIDAFATNGNLVVGVASVTLAGGTLDLGFIYDILGNSTSLIHIPQALDPTVTDNITSHAAYAINTTGNIVGDIILGVDQRRPFIKFGTGPVVDIGPQNDLTAKGSANGINNSNIVVGGIENAEVCNNFACWRVRQAFISDQNANPTTFSYLTNGALFASNNVGSWASDVNIAGDVVGNAWFAVPGSASAAAVVWRLNTTTGAYEVYNLNAEVDANVYPGWEFYAAEDIDDQGRIVGMGTLNGVSTAFMLVPIPGSANSVGQAAQIFIEGGGSENNNNNNNNNNTGNTTQNNNDTVVVKGGIAYLTLVILSLVLLLRRNKQQV